MVTSFSPKLNKCNELYLCSLLGHFHQGTELVPDAGQRQLLEETLLGLSQHEPDQHAEHRWTQVVAGSVGVRLLQLVQRPCRQEVNTLEEQPGNRSKPMMNEALLQQNEELISIPLLLNPEL